MTGMAEGGLFDVVREQDGRRFPARLSPEETGIYRPTDGTGGGSGRRICDTGRGAGQSYPRPADRHDRGSTPQRDVEEPEHGGGVPGHDADAVWPCRRGIYRHRPENESRQWRRHRPAYGRRPRKTAEKAGRPGEGLCIGPREKRHQRGIRQI